MECKILLCGFVFVFFHHRQEFGHNSKCSEILFFCFLRFLLHVNRVPVATYLLVENSCMLNVRRDHHPLQVMLTKIWKVIIALLLYFLEAKSKILCLYANRLLSAHFPLNLCIVILMYQFFFSFNGENVMVLVLHPLYLQCWHLFCVHYSCSHQLLCKTIPYRKLSVNVLKINVYIRQRDQISEYMLIEAGFSESKTVFSLSYIEFCLLMSTRMALHKCGDMSNLKPDTSCFFLHG